MRRFRRLAAVLVLALAPLGLGGSPASGASAAADGTSVRELVVTSLAPDGTAEGTSAIELVRLHEGGSVRLESDGVEELRSLSGFSTPDETPAGYVWRASERTDVLSVAETTRSLPLSVDVRYRLDGRRVSADDLEGAEGDVEIEIRLRNAARVVQEVAYEDASGEAVTENLPVYLPLQYSVQTSFPTAGWDELSANDSALTPDPEGDLNVNLSGLLAPPLTGAATTLTITGHTDRAMLPAVRIFALPGIPGGADAVVAEQLGALRDLLGAIDGIGSRLATAAGGAGELGDGLDEILASVGRLDPDTGRPVDDPGDPKTLLGALGAIEAAVAERFLPGVGARDPATGEPVVVLGADGRPTTAIGALGFIASQLEDPILAGIGSRDPETGRAVEVTDAQGRAQTLLWGLQSTKDTLDGKLIPGVDRTVDGIDELLVGLDAVAGDDPGFREGLEGIKQLAVAGQGVPGTPAPVLGILAQISAVSDGLLAGLGERNPDGTPKILLDAEGDPATVIAALGVIRSMALTNPAFDVAQPALGGRVPFEYFQECPACFDPASDVFDPFTAAFQPGFREVFRLFSAGLTQVMGSLQSFDPSDPGLVEGLGAVEGGLLDLAARLHSLDASDPGLVDGLGQLRSSVGDLLGRLHTFDAEDPGLVDGLQLARGGVSKLEDGLGLLRVLGIGTVEAQLGPTAEGLAKTDGVLEAEAERVLGHTFLAAGADVTSTTYLFQLPAQTTQGRDNAVRGGLIALSALAVAVLARRPRLGGL